jgi:hypothetical protein
MLLAADVAIGISTAVLVLLQATLLARIIATSFEGGAPLDEVSGELVLLVGVFTVRGGEHERGVPLPYGDPNATVGRLHTETSRTAT